MMPQPPMGGMGAPMGGFQTASTNPSMGMMKGGMQPPMGGMGGQGGFM